MPGRQPTRRQVLRTATASTLSVAVGGLLAACTTAPTPSTTPRSTVSPTARDDRVLLAYFSRPGENYWNGGRRTIDTGNTEVLAGLIGDRIDCDVVRIEAADPYSDRYDATVARNSTEQDDDARPEIASELPDLRAYDTVLLGSPIWNVQPPMIMATFVEAVDLSGKRLLPVVTYAVSGLGSTESFYRDLDTGATLGEGLAVRGEDVRERAAGDDVDRWLRNVGLT
ncbi:MULTISPECIES: flavodoxin [unclassified Curtobacterium]|uniref:flavodoxin n=1 Tax=unclassified Curtobacterium TaxID=257496 RepID=UPI000F4E4064|nr:flavodoxin [Curtobacterium sp. PhB137]